MPETHITLRPSKEMYALTRVFAKMHSAHASIELMKAKNTEREMLGQALAYSDESFYAVQQDLEEILKEIDIIEAEASSNTEDV